MLSATTAAALCGCFCCLAGLCCVIETGKIWARALRRRLQEGGHEMFNRTTMGFDWGEFITGIALLIGAAVMWRNPGATMLTLSFIFAIIAIIRGVATLAAFPKLHQLTGGLAYVSALAGVLDLVVGVLFIFNLESAVIAVAYLFAAWFLIDSIANALNAGHLRQAGTGWFVINLFLDIVSIFIGLLFIMQPVISAVGMVTLLCMFFAVWGINAIITAFARRNI